MDTAFKCSRWYHEIEAVPQASKVSTAVAYYLASAEKVGVVVVVTGRINREEVGKAIKGPETR